MQTVPVSATVFAYWVGLRCKIHRKLSRLPAAGMVRAVTGSRIGCRRWLWDEKNKQTLTTLLPFSLHLGARLFKASLSRMLFS